MPDQSAPKGLWGRLAQLVCHGGAPCRHPEHRVREKTVAAETHARTPPRLEFRGPSAPKYCRIRTWQLIYRPIKDKRKAVRTP